MEEYSRLTDRQIFDLYYYPRNEDGSLDSQHGADRRELAGDDETEEPASLQGDLNALKELAAALRMPLQRQQELRAQIEEKWKKSCPS